MSKPGLGIEHAAGIIARDLVTKHFEVFGHVIRADRVASQSVVAAFIDGLAGALALSIAGGFGEPHEMTEATIAMLRDAVKRDLRHLRRPLQS